MPEDLAYLVLQVSTIVFIGATAASLLSHDHWVIRVFDFPRKQIAVGIALTMASLWALRPQAPATITALGGLSASLLYQIDHIIQYTWLAPMEVTEAVPERPETEPISVLTANVEVDNRRPGPFLQIVKEQDPDVVLIIETDEWWARKLEPLSQAYEHRILHPQENAYGMCLFSKRPFQSAEVRYLTRPDVPSIKAEITTNRAAPITFWGIHPRPPHPVHEPDTTFRDAELITLAREIRENGGPTIVAGDLNDVSWSHTTDLFQRIGGLLDPRRGRGFYNSFHARYPIIRYPLDHTFHSEHFRVRQLEVLRYIGSDHYPVLAELQLDPQAPSDHSKPEKCHIVDGWADYEMKKLKRKLQEQNPSDHPLEQYPSLELALNGARQ